MKCILAGAVAALLLIAANGAALAQEGTEVEVGVKFWFNDWTQDAPGSASITSDTVTLFGPTIEVKFSSSVFVEASYLVSVSDYTFTDVFGSTNIERQDLDAAIGYMIVPGFGVLAGYKDSSFKNRTSGFTSDVYGPVIGIIGIAQVDPYLSFYGRLNYLFTKFKNDDPLSSFPKEDSPGWIVEFGVKYAFTREFSGSIGYKYETNEGNDSSVRDTFSGLTLSGIVSF
jgi:Outer membrane protein beta-barrel domain